MLYNCAINEQYLNSRKRKPANYIDVSSIRNHATTHRKLDSSPAPIPQVSHRQGNRAANGVRSQAQPLRSHRDATMILVAYRHGLRASEVCDLQWHQIGPRRGACTVLSPKKPAKYRHFRSNLPAARARTQVGDPPPQKLGPIPAISSSAALPTSIRWSNSPCAAHSLSRCSMRPHKPARLSAATPISRRVASPTESLDSLRN
jgi:hypothetical protein